MISQTVQTVNQLTLQGVVRHVLVRNGLEGYVSKPREKIEFHVGYGIKADSHAGTRLTDVRDPLVNRHMPKGQGCQNVRQWSAISSEEIDAAKGDLEQWNGGKKVAIPAGYLGENLIISGIPNFSKLPTGTLLFFKSPKGELRQTVLYIHAENGPCSTVGDYMENQFGIVGLSAAIVKNLKDRRGLVGFVYVSGFVKEGDTVIVEIPEQRLYTIEDAGTALKGLTQEE